MVLTIAAILVVRSARFHDYVLRTVDTKASAALNTPVHLQNFALRLSTLSLDLYGLTIEGAGPGANQPLLQAEHGHFDIGMTSIFHREWYVDDITVDHPVVKLIVDKNGNTNLPDLRKATAARTPMSSILASATCCSTAARSTSTTRRCRCMPTCTIFS